MISICLKVKLWNLHYRKKHRVKHLNIQKKITVICTCKRGRNV